MQITRGDGPQWLEIWAQATQSELGSFHYLIRIHPDWSPSWETEPRPHDVK